MNKKEIREVNIFKDNIDLNKIDIVEKRVKTFIINDKNEIMFIESDNGCQLIGGHIEENEKPEEALIREIKEESGIDLKSKVNFNLFFIINYYYKVGTKNKHSSVMYYYTKSNEKPNILKTNLTKEEEYNKLKTVFINFDIVKDYLKQFKHNKQKKINLSIINEIEQSYDELKKILNNN